MEFKFKVGDCFYCKRELLTNSKTISIIQCEDYLLLKDEPGKLWRWTPKFLKYLINTEYLVKVSNRHVGGEL